ncbi:hypothetical protein HZA57_02465 [Candidatus Poribacteria bacterium]|nr:hypothetical protein [Candidatus Poribacteria bacterium]
MMLLADGLILLGFLICITGGIWLLVEQFRSGIWWGLGCLFCLPIVGFIWIVTHWKDAWRPLLVNLGGIVPIAIGMLIFLIETAASTPPPA